MSVPNTPDSDPTSLWQGAAAAGAQAVALTLTVSRQSDPGKAARGGGPGWERPRSPLPTNADRGTAGTRASRVLPPGPRGPAAAGALSLPMVPRGRCELAPRGAKRKSPGHAGCSCAWGAAWGARGPGTPYGEPGPQPRPARREAPLPTPAHAGSRGAKAAGGEGSAPGQRRSGVSRAPRTRAGRRGDGPRGTAEGVPGRAWPSGKRGGGHAREGGRGPSL